MTEYCKFCDKSMLNKEKYKHSCTINHKTLDESIIGRYYNFNPNVDYVHEKMKGYIIIHKKNFELNGVQCVLKLLTPTHRVRYVKINTKLTLDYLFNFSKTSLLSRINQNWYYFSHFYERRITFSSSVRDYLTYDY